MESYCMCPECKRSDTAQHWDANTRLRLGLIDDIEEHIEDPTDERYLPINGDADFMEETKATYYCPLCGAEVPGTEVARSR